MTHFNTGFGNKKEIIVNSLKFLEGSRGIGPRFPERAIGVTSMPNAPSWGKSSD
jgi:hypothetical protein